MSDWNQGDVSKTIFDCLGPIWAKATTDAEKDFVRGCVRMVMGESAPSVVPKKARSPNRSATSGGQQSWVRKAFIHAKDAPLTPEQIYDTCFELNFPISSNRETGIAWVEAVLRKNTSLYRRNHNLTYQPRKGTRLALVSA